MSFKSWYHDSAPSGQFQSLLDSLYLDVAVAWCRFTGIEAQSPSYRDPGGTRPFQPIRDFRANTPAIEVVSYDVLYLTFVYAPTVAMFESWRLAVAMIQFVVVMLLLHGTSVAPDTSGDKPPFIHTILGRSANLASTGLMGAWAAASLQSTPSADLSLE